MSDLSKKISTVVLVPLENRSIEDHFRLDSAISSFCSGLTKSFYDIVRLCWSTSVTATTYCG